MGRANPPWQEIHQGNKNLTCGAARSHTATKVPIVFAVRDAHRCDLSPYAAAAVEGVRVRLCGCIGQCWCAEHDEVIVQGRRYHPLPWRGINGHEECLLAPGSADANEDDTTANAAAVVVCAPGYNYGCVSIECHLSEAAARLIVCAWSSLSVSSHPPSGIRSNTYTAPRPSR